MQKKSLSNKEFRRILTNNGKDQNALDLFFKTLENWGDNRNKITFYIVKSTTLRDVIEIAMEEDEISKNCTVNLAVYDVLTEVYGDEKAYEKFADKYSGRKVCITKKRKNKEVDYKAEYEDLCSGMSVKEVAKKYGKSPAAIRKDKSRYLQMLNESVTKVSTVQQIFDNYYTISSHGERTVNLQKGEQRAMKTRTMKKAWFEYPECWIELNAEQASETEHVVIVTDANKIAVFYSSVPCFVLGHADAEKIKKLASKAGLEEDKICLYGLIEEGLGVKNVGNARIVRR